MKLFDITTMIMLENSEDFNVLLVIFELDLNRNIKIDPGVFSLRLLSSI